MAEIRLANYQLVDFGDGRKLESIDEYLIDRPSPSAAWARPARPELWQEADAVFNGHQWGINKPWPAELRLECGAFSIPLSAKPFGHIGAFPEQAANWSWLQRRAMSFESQPKALNLFAYTGAASLALATGGATVAHVDAAKPNVQASRLAAECSEASALPIRYLVDDAITFSRREVRRGRRYSLLVLDPPTYGHDPRGKAWRIERDIWELLSTLIELAEPTRSHWLITGHSPTIAYNEILDWFHHESPLTMIDVETGAMNLSCGERRLNAGWFLRMTTRS